MPELTESQLDVLRLDLGAFGSADGTNVYFTDDQLQSNAGRVGGANYWHAILGLCFLQLMASQARGVDVVGAEIEAKGSQVMAHVRVLYLEYKPALMRALGMTPSDVLFSEVTSGDDRDYVNRGPIETGDTYAWPE